MNFHKVDDIIEGHAHYDELLARLEALTDSELIDLRHRVNSEIERLEIIAYYEAVEEINRKK